MNSLFALFIFFGLVAAVCAAAKSFLASRPAARKMDPNWQPPAADPLPYTRRRYFFSAAERSFYEVLRRVIPEHTVFAKVRLADVIRVPKGTDAWRAHQNRIDRKHLDFVICDANLAPVAAVELDDSSHDSEKRKERDEFVDAALTAAGVPIIHVRASRGYELDELRALLSPHLAIPAFEPAEVAGAASAFQPSANWRPAV